jgi:uncharacterized membrane protein HdeD (DUF308 family)
LAIVPTASFAASPDRVQQRENTVIVIGIILLIIGFVAQIAIIWTIGIVLLIVGAALAIAGAAGREIGGRKRWY